MDWVDDPAGQAATLIPAPYRCRVWYTTLGNWAAVIRHHGLATAAYNFPILEEAKAWREAQLAERRKPCRCANDGTWPCPCCPPRGAAAADGQRRRECPGRCCRDLGATLRPSVTERTPDRPAHARQARGDGPMATKGMPDDIQRAATDRVAAFNRTEISEPQCFYVPRFKGRYLYLDRVDFGHQGPICRLTYTGDLTHWDFAIYKYSDGAYDPGEWMFPGAEEVDGTIAGALRAGLKAYPA